VPISFLAIVSWTRHNQIQAQFQLGDLQHLCTTINALEIVLSFPLKIAQPQDFTLLTPSFYRTIFIHGRIISLLLELRRPNFTLNGESLQKDILVSSGTWVSRLLPKSLTSGLPLFL